MHTAVPISQHERRLLRIGERDADIVEMWNAGRPVPVIARKHGISEVNVRRIVNARRKDAAQGV